MILFSKPWNRESLVFPRLGKLFTMNLHMALPIYLMVSLAISAAAPEAITRPVTLESQRLVVQMNTNGLMTLRDKLSNQQWQQVVTSRDTKIAVDQIERVTPTAMRLQLHTRKYAFSTEVALQAGGTEVEVALKGEALPERLAYPPPFLPSPQAKLILAIKEGLAVPVQDTKVFFDNQKRGSFQFFEGHNSAMPFWGFANRDGSGLMTLVLTPNDAGFLISRQKGLLTDQVLWEAESGRFGYARRLRYVPVERGGYVAMAQRYRAQAEADGLVKTLKEKIRTNPNVERLLGAADVWFNDHRRQVTNYVAVAQQLRGLGIERAIFNAPGNWMQEMSQQDITAINAMGYLSGRYDQFQDVMPSSNFVKLLAVNPLYRQIQMQKAWPADIVMNVDGTSFRGWPEHGKDGQIYYCCRIADKVRLKYTQEIITRDLAEHDYLARFIDTEAATAWNENYNPLLRTTRSEVRAARQGVLNFISDAAHLVTGSEGLSAYFVPSVDYFEGVGPVEPFRIPQKDAHPFQTFPANYDWGTNMTQLLEVSHRYLIPLWQLVFHDCVVSYLRWNEANNKYAHPLWWKKQALFCALEGRPPIFMFDPAWWNETENQNHLAEIYRLTGPLAKKVGTARMVDHRWLDASGDVQQTSFDNGVTVTVNFAQKNRKLPNGTDLAPFALTINEGQR